MVRESRVLAVVVCAALSARHIQDFVVLAQEADWDVWIVATPNALAFVDVPLLEALTQHPVYSSLPASSPAVALSAVRAVVVVPATFNTLKKWVRGDADTLALRLLLTWAALRIPILVFPRASAELAQDPDFAPSLAHLRARGIRVVYEPERYPPNNAIPWRDVLQELVIVMKP